MKFKPMLAPQDDPLKNKNFFQMLTFPSLWSPKIDGVRSVGKGGVCKSRKFIDLPNECVQRDFGAYAELDGEFALGSETDSDLCPRTSGHIRAHLREATDLHYRVFDCADTTLANEPFIERLDHASRLVEEYLSYNLGSKNVSMVKHTMCKDLDALLAYEAEQLAAGYEGVMGRNPYGRYKHGRATMNDGLIWKLKRFQDAEAIVTGFVEATKNENPDIRDNLGNAKRSTAMAGLVPANTLGSLLMEYKGNEIEVACGTLTHKQRKEIWDNQEKYRYKIATLRFFGYGTVVLPRFGRFINWRESFDI